MRVGVTGGAGFIGSHVVDALAGAGHEVIVLDQKAPHRLDVEHRGVDLMDRERFAAATRGLDALFHLAAYADVNDVVRDPVGAIDLNISGTLRALESARANGIGRFVLASSVWVYSSHQPATPDATVDEDALISIDINRHVYTTTKLAAEMLCHDYWNAHGLPFTILRYGIPYGPRMRPSLVIPIFVRKALNGEALTITGDGSQHRKFVYVEDLARGHVLALSDAGKNETFNLDGAEKVTILRIAETVMRLTGSKQPIEFLPARSGDYDGVNVSSEKAARLLGWRPRTTFDEGMRETVAWLAGRGMAATPAAPQEAAARA
ncbi:MAG TPA: NAD-dependent epimerase/dehydratase family protein [Dehalococcoidia bacterium]